MKNSLYWGLGSLMLIAFGCKDQPEAIPAYLEIKPFIVNAEGGTGWQKITEGYVYVNREYLGAYTLPASVPVLAEGASLVWVYPGVRNNGVAATPDIYPFLLRYEISPALTGGQTIPIQPVSAYDPDSKFSWNLDRTTFDGNSSVVFENRDNDDNSSFVLSTDGAFSGKSLLMQVDTAHPTIQIASEAVVLPTDRTQVWLEMNYKNDLLITIFLLGNGSGASESGQQVLNINPKENWNKIYINLTELLLTSQRENYRLFFQVTLPKDDAGKYTQTTGTARIDNLRLVHY